MVVGSATSDVVVATGAAVTVTVVELLEPEKVAASPVGRGYRIVADGKAAAFHRQRDAPVDDNGTLPKARGRLRR